MQETYSQTDAENEWIKRTRGEVIISHGETNSKGTAIIFRNELDYKLNEEIVHSFGINYYSETPLDRTLKIPEFFLNQTNVLVRKFSLYLLFKINLSKPEPLYPDDNFSTKRYFTKE